MSRRGQSAPPLPRNEAPGVVRTSGALHFRCPLRVCRREDGVLTQSARSFPQGSSYLTSSRSGPPNAADAESARPAEPFRNRFATTPLPAANAVPAASAIWPWWPL